jgi:hypothetical protein
VVVWAVGPDLEITGPREARGLTARLLGWARRARPLVEACLGGPLGAVRVVAYRGAPVDGEALGGVLAPANAAAYAVPAEGVVRVDLDRILGARSPAGVIGHEFGHIAWHRLSGLADTGRRTPRWAEEGALLRLVTSDLTPEEQGAVSRWARMDAAREFGFERVEAGLASGQPWAYAQALIVGRHLDLLRPGWPARLLELLRRDSSAEGDAAVAASLGTTRGVLEATCRAALERFLEAEAG